LREISNVAPAKTAPVSTRMAARCVEVGAGQSRWTR
jgi:hypothetical protein